MKRPLAFALVTAVVAGVTALILIQLFPAPHANAAIWISAGLSFVVQLVGFEIARRYARSGDVMKGWGIGALLRVAALAIYGFVGPRVFGLPIAPALLSFTIIVFISTVIEPLFLSA